MTIYYCERCKTVHDNLLSSCPKGDDFVVSLEQALYDPAARELTELWRAAKRRAAELEVERDRLKVALSETEGALAAIVANVWPDNPVAHYDEIAEEFRRETGLMAPGKSRPAAMGPEAPEDERRRWDAWDSFRVRRGAALLAQARAALAKARGETP